MASPPESKAAEVDSPAAPSTISELFYSPVNLLITVIIAALVYRFYKSKYGIGAVKAPAPELPRIRKDMTAAELRSYDGTQPDGRVLVAVNGWIFDATKGRRFYGPGKRMEMSL